MQAFTLERLVQSSIPPSSICFEVTETSAVRDTKQAQQFISALKNAGCQFALDDFGAGLSSFEWLQNLPFDYLKIDGRYIHDLKHRNYNEPFVKALHQLAHSLNMQTIAEHVESETTLRRIQQLGIDFAQGWQVGTVQSLKYYEPFSSSTDVVS